MPLKLHWSALAAILIAVSGFLVSIAVDSMGTDPLAEFGSVPNFALIDHNGEAFSLGDLDGELWVADFIFTNCAGTCPMMTEQMGALNDRLPEEVRLISITVDPTRDTPEVLSGYAAGKGAEGDRWVFLTGSRDEIYRLAKEGFHLAVDDTVGTFVEPITHSSRFALVDRAGTIRSYFDGTDPATVSRISEAVEGLLSEPR